VLGYFQPSLRDRFRLGRDGCIVSASAVEFSRSKKFNLDKSEAQPSLRDLIWKREFSHAPYSTPRAAKSVVVCFSGLCKGAIIGTLTKGDGEMKKIVLIVFFGGVALLSIALYSQQSQPKRVGMIIGIKPDKISAYEALHAASNQGVRDLLDKYHMNNFSIYIHKMDESHYYLFAYYEYTGNDYKKDMDTMAKEPRNIKWLSVTDAMQIPFPGQTSWTKMQEVFHNP
jgi:L-rhamnose mutarotase